MGAPAPAILIVRFEENAPAASRAGTLERLGLPDAPDDRARWHHPTLLTVRLPAVPGRDTLRELRALPGVCRLLTLGPGERLSGKRNGSSTTVTLPGGFRLGGPSLGIIAGPCSVESEPQVLETAALVKAHGAVALRGGAFKPRTSPYAFSGLREEGLRILAKAREQTGLPIVTEVLDPADLPAVAAVADVLQVGSRNMHNGPFLFSVGREGRGRPVLLKRGFAATVDELLEAAEHVLLGQLAAGHEEAGVVLCERGIRTFETSTRFTLDVGAIPVLKQRTSLPVVVDPSHPAGLDCYVLPLARAALAAGADGLLVEVHVRPSEAWCDGEQSLSPAQFEELMRSVQLLQGLRAPRGEDAAG